MRTALGLLAALLSLAPTPQPPSLTEVLDRATMYALNFKRQFIGIVTEEIYTQDVVTYTRFRPEVTHRELKSDFLLVRTEENERYVEFRDVAEVDGRLVRDRADRLTRLFLEPDKSADQIQKIMQESSRYNIGRVLRNVNTPTLALAFLDPEYKSRFTFSIAADRTPALAMRAEHARDAASPSFVVPTDVWVVEYQETRPRTIIRSPENRDMPAHGRFWLEGDTGRLIMTELIAGDGSLRATIDVSYQSEPLLGFSVPVEMRERYEAPNVVISGTATYGNFRKFEVKVESTQKQ